MNRQQTIRKILAARTPEELFAARGLRAAYLRDHPDDFEVMETGNYITRREEALEIIKTAHRIAR